MDDDSKEMLQAMGFKEVPGKDLWIFRQKHEDAETEAVIYLETKDGFVGHVPFVNQYLSDDVPEKTLFLATDDVKDIIALAQNQIASTVSEAGYELDVGFEHDGILITKPFMSNPWFDFALISENEIKNPKDVFEDLYVQWRDEFADSLLPGPSPRL